VIQLTVVSLHGLVAVMQLSDMYAFSCYAINFWSRISAH